MARNYAWHLGIMSSHMKVRRTRQRRACIALYPTANSTGAWVLWKIENKTRLRRTNYIKLVTNDLIIDALNQIALSEEHEASQPEVRVNAELEAQDDTQQGAQEESQQGSQEDTQQEAQEDTQ
jgi:hypothetical protein